MTCKNCGYDYGLHHAVTAQCPRGGEAPIGKKQQWLDTHYVDDCEEDSNETNTVIDDVACLARAIRELSSVVDGVLDRLQKLEGE